MTAAVRAAALAAAVAAAASAGLADCAAPACEDGFVPLFDGRTLAGWSVRGGENQFSVEDGCIKGVAVPSDVGINTFLVTDKSYGDFDLKVEFRIEGGNSGIQFRATDRSYDPSVDWCDYPGRRKVYGYQAEITPSGDCTGRIYDEERRGFMHGIVWLDVATPKARLDAAKASFRKGGWNEMRVRCEGPRIRTWLNGVPVADVLDDLDKRGYVGLQVHVQHPPKKEGEKFVPGMVWWRNVRIRELPSGPQYSERRIALDRDVSRRCQNAGGTNEVVVIESEGRTVLRLNGFEVYDSALAK